MRAIIGRIKPTLEPLYATDLKNQPEEMLKAAVRANVRSGVDRLRRDSRIIEDLTNNDGLMVVGAEYSLETGVVDFFEGIPES